MTTSVGHSDEAGVVESLFADYLGLVDDLQAKSPSGLSALNSVYSKALLIASASNLEFEVRRLLEEAVTERGGIEIGEFVRQTALARGYHGLIDWETGQATKLFATFGKECKKRFKEYAKSEAADGRQRAFVELGSERNSLVHNDFARQNLTKSPEEIMELHRLASQFVRDIESIIFSVTRPMAEPGSASGASG